MRTKVLLTIDTEFSIAGAFADPMNKRPIGAQNVWCEVNGRSEGLGFMLETFRTHGVRATFFTEVLQTAFFGDQPMGEIVHRIAELGHDLQLHLHPVWTYFERPNWQQRLAREEPADNMHGRPVAQLVHWMQHGIDTFARWGLPAPVALRTGNLMVDLNVYRAMAQVGLKVASNVARAVFEPDEQSLRLNAGIHTVEGITELPVLTYAGLRVASRIEHKLLTITGSSIGEAVCLLERAHVSGCRAVVLLTHCHEFIKGDAFPAPKANYLNQQRLVGLCRYLQKNDDRFEVTTMNQMASAHAGAETEPDPLLAVPAWRAIARMLQNKLSDRNVI